jgi:DNA repair protein RadC
MKENDTNVFKGHRERMRRKLHAFGTRVFETYELIEMLLFSVIPRRNTHPTAKLLLKEFPTLDALFAADKEKLSKISGIGDECAQFLYDVGAFLNQSEENGQSLNKKFFESYEDIGAFFADYFKGKSTCETAVLLLDSKLSYIDIRSIYSLDLSSGAVQAKPFIDAALQNGATLCAVAHNHPHSSPYPTEGDWESAKALKSAFAEAGLVLLENYVVTEEGYKRFSNDKIQKSASVVSFELCLASNSAPSFSSLLAPIIKKASKKSAEIISDIEKGFASKRELFESDIGKLESVINSKSISELIVILAALAARKNTESFKFGKKHSEDEIKAFLTAYYSNVPRESVSILPLDKSACVIAIEALSDGTANATGIMPRTILEKLGAYASSSFIMAHNHPSGLPEPSDEDIRATAKLYEALLSCGITLVSHFVVAGGECHKIDFLEN